MLRIPECAANCVYGSTYDYCSSLYFDNYMEFEYCMQHVYYSYILSCHMSCQWECGYEYSICVFTKMSQMANYCQESAGMAENSCLDET